MNELVSKALKEARLIFEQIDSNALTVQARVLAAFQRHTVSTRHFHPTNGYGYDDIGRDTLDRVFADVLEAEDALVRPQIVNGTHAIYLALCGLTSPGDVILSATGEPYDTLQTALTKDGALRQQGIVMQSIPLTENGFDMENVLGALAEPSVKVLYMQRSRGYSWRPALSVTEIHALCAEARKIRPELIVFVDNCYGECTEAHEPCYYGVDCVAGSLIKNLGGGLAPTGGYIAGTQECISHIENVLTVPGIGREVGSYAQSYRPFYQGLFQAPHTVAQALKCAVLFAFAMQEKGLPVLPAWDTPRADITQSIRFPNQDQLIRFCRGIQGCSPVDSHVTPEPWDMPGYADPIIMAAGTFVQGATLELSADAPIRAPYTVYLQGALTLEHAILALDHVLNTL